MHQVNSRINVMSAGYKFIGAKPLPDDIAMKDGSGMIAESIVFGVAGAIVVYEYVKGVIVGKAIYDKNLEVEDALKLLS